MTAKRHMNAKVQVGKGLYGKLDFLDGTHPIQDEAPGTHVLYRVRKRKHGKVCYFNFDLAKEMGIIGANHPRKLNLELSKKLLDTFSLIIINEFDIINNKKFPSSDIKPNPYMATRYLQMQHNSRIGKTSGDGRAIWNGIVEHEGTTWDVTSCGTGATCLSPASANNQIFYESGDPSISYGCGYAESMEAVGNSVFSEILHRNGIPTERTLCIIEYPGDFCVVVRAGRNLLRPSHFFNHLKQNHYRRLKDMFDLFLKRQVNNGEFKPGRIPLHKRYDAALEYIAKLYARSCALFEREYIFCWLDWDGDNVLADGGIIDYGSIRQLGLCHHDYCFDDDERWSTNLRQQRQKGRYITQTFAQLIDFLKHGVRKSRDKFSNHRSLKLFDQEFENEKLRLLLRRVGLPLKLCAQMVGNHKKVIRDFEESFEALERWTSTDGLVEVPDGITRYAIYDMRAFLRLMPDFIGEDASPALIADVHEQMLSSLANKEDRVLTRTKEKHLKNLIEAYNKIIRMARQEYTAGFTDLMTQLQRRSAIINDPNRVTGDAMFYVGKKLFAKRKTMPSDKWHELIKRFIDEQTLDPDLRDNCDSPDPKLEQSLLQLRKIVNEFREGL